ncbi:MAG: tetratricopeptide repeat protein [Opitutales bacterium]|jgi:outer membrane protein assembly factor BamD
MFRPILAFFALAATATLFPCTANAYLWGLIGGGDQWRSQDPVQQNELAKPLMDKAIAAENAGAFKKARNLYEKTWRTYPGSEFAPEAVYRTGKISMSRQEWKRALAAYNVLVQAYPESRHFNDVVADFFDIASAYEEGVNIHMLWVLPFKDTTKAIRVYETLVAIAPYSDYAPVALMRIAMLHRRERQAGPAVDALDRIINNYPQSMLAADATLLLADYLFEEVRGPEYDQGATREAMSYYRDFMTLYPTNPAVKDCEKGLAQTRETYAQSKFILGEFFFKYRDDYDSAAVFFNDAITIAPESQSADKARVYLAKIAKIREHFPEGNWPVRKDWQYLFFWRSWNPLNYEPAAKKIDPTAPSPEATLPIQKTPDNSDSGTPNRAD